MYGRTEGFFFAAMVVLLGVGAVGCFGPKPTEQIELEVPTWPALEKLRSDELLMPIGTSALAEDWDAVGSLVTADDFQAAVEEFASTPVPKAWATPERTAAKDKTAEQLKSLIEAAEQKKPSGQLKTLWEASQKSLSELSKPMVAAE